MKKGFTPHPECCVCKHADEWYKPRSELPQCPERKLVGAGFTLMELLIVIAVIGILISISTVAYTSAQKKSRDSRRRSDLKALSSGFEQYYADNSSNYPGTCSLSTTYMPNGMPTDPKTGTAYTSTSDWYSCSTSSFCVCAALESETNSTNDCSGDQVSLPAGYLGFYCAKSVQ